MMNAAEMLLGSYSLIETSSTLTQKDLPFKKLLTALHVHHSEVQFWEL